MSRGAALVQYERAYKQGIRYYNACVARGVSPYPEVLDEIVDENKCAGKAKIGLVDIPLDLVVGTTTAGRRTAFAGNFMPLLEEETEFGSKWVNLCEAHLDLRGGGIHDPIICNEYMGRFYVTEGNKRVSVLKSYDAATIPGIVTRIIPAYSEDPAVQIYYEFMEFYKLSQVYEVRMRRVGGFSRLPAALGFAPGHKWTEDERRDFRNAYRKLQAAFRRLNAEDELPLEAGDALMAWLELYTLQELDGAAEPEINKRLSAMWPDLKLLVSGASVALNTEHEEGEKGGLLRALGIGRVSHLNIAFVHSFDPKKSAWTAAHELGRQHLEEVMGDRVTVTTHVCSLEDADETMEKVVADGAQVIFTTTPPLIDACRKTAALHPQVKLLNCSLSMPYTGVRTYYSRMYEGKFITGAIAGAMTKEDRVGYIANYPIAGTPAAINAFALGVRMTNPNARISLKWSCLPGDPVSQFLEEGVSIISNRENAAGESHYAWEWGTYQVEEDGTLTPLASPCWNWGSFYEKVVSSIFAGTWEQSGGRDEAVNYWWGMSSGVIDVLLSDKLPAGSRQLAEVLKSGLASGWIDPFQCEIRDQQGKIRNAGTAHLSMEELMNMDWLCDNVDGAIPTFEELLPASRPLVRQLGLERDQLPLETEETT